MGTNVLLGCYCYYKLIVSSTFIGDYIVILLWGDYSVGIVTLNRFFTLHFLLPFVLLALIGLHFFLLHNSGSTNPLGTDSEADTLPFFPYFIIKDLFTVVITLYILFLLSMEAPDLLGHPDNSIPANDSSTPEHIVPEWYFLPFYAILRCIPDKTLGIVALLFSILILFFLPMLGHTRFSMPATFMPLRKLLMTAIVLTFVLLGYLGQAPMTEPWTSISQQLTAIYFTLFVLLSGLKS